MDLNFDIENLARHKKPLALLGNSESVFSGEGVMLDTDPDHDGGRLSYTTNANNLYARTLNPLRTEDVIGLKSELVLPDCDQGVVSDRPKKLFFWPVHVKSIGARASHKDWLGGQPIVVKLGLQIGAGGARGRGGGKILLQLYLLGEGEVLNVRRN